ncbi:hypothetical protein HDU84_005173 [Entophlyctis sp. JEL0112]|nr:hypothetical protein HDU84_005173 [Entophlyctis sp. JEL0112]
METQVKRRKNVKQPKPVQEAFETLVHPMNRFKYDCAHWSQISTTVVEMNCYKQLGLVPSDRLTLDDFEKALRIGLRNNASSDAVYATLIAHKMLANKQERVKYDISWNLAVSFDIVKTIKLHKLQVHPGIIDGFTHCVEGEGHKRADGYAGNLVFRFEYEPHEFFSRGIPVDSHAEQEKKDKAQASLTCKFDLEFEAALSGGKFNLTDTIEIVLGPGEALKLPNGLKCLAGQGLPVFGSSECRGDIFVAINLLEPQLWESDSIVSQTDITNEQTPPAQNIQHTTGLCTESFQLDDVSQIRFSGLVNIQTPGLSEISPTRSIDSTLPGIAASFASFSEQIPSVVKEASVSGGTRGPNQKRSRDDEPELEPKRLCLRPRIPCVELVPDTPSGKNAKSKAPKDVVGNSQVNKLQNSHTSTLVPTIGDGVKTRGQLRKLAELEIKIEEQSKRRKRNEEPIATEIKIEEQSKRRKRNEEPIATEIKSEEQSKRRKRNEEPIATKCEGLRKRGRRCQVQPRSTGTRR